MQVKIMTVAAALASSGVICALATILIRRWSLRGEFVDRPGGHKGHDRPVALGGGIAITFAVSLPMLLGVAAAHLVARHPPNWIPGEIARHAGGIVAQSTVALALLAASAVLCLVGVLDDRKPLRASTKLTAQVVVAAVLVIGFDVRLLSHLGPIVSSGLSILWIVTLSNSLNFLDNMDGLAAGVAAIAAMVFAVVAMQAGQFFVPVCCALLAGSLLGFLPFNFHPASIYMGDAGSLVIGMLLAVFTILTTFADPAQSQAPIGVIAPLVVMAVPLYDTLSVVYLRWRLGVPIWTGDRRHFSHRLVRRGMSVRRAVVLIYLATLATGLPAILLPNAGWVEAGLIFGNTLLIVAVVALLEGSSSHEAPTT